MKQKRQEWERLEREKDKPTCRRYSLSLFLGICHFEAARWGVFVLKLHLLQADRKPLHLYDPPWYSMGLLHKGHMSSAPNIIPSTLPTQKHQNTYASGQSFCKSLSFLTVSNSCSPNWWNSHNEVSISTITTDKWTVAAHTATQQLSGPLSSSMCNAQILTNDLASHTQSQRHPGCWLSAFLVTRQCSHAGASYPWVPTCLLTASPIFYPAL